MGAKQAKWANDCASIFINLPSDQYAPGEYIQGQVEILVKKAFKVNDLDLVLDGEEQTQWWVHTDKVHIRYGGKKKVIDQRIPLVSFFGNELAVGFHKVDFGFQLPATLPGAFMWYHSDWYARIEYKLRVELKAVENSESLEFERFLLIQEKHIPAKEEIKEMEIEHKIKTMGMFSKGTGKIRARIENNEYTVSDTARVFLDIDNSACKASIKYVTISLKRAILIYSEKGYKKYYSKTVVEEKFPGLPKKEVTPEGEPRLLELDLKKFMTQFLDKKAKKYKEKVWKHYGDYFLQPTTHTELINCSYFIKIKPHYDVTWKIWSGAPKVKLPIALGIPADQKIHIEYEEQDEFKTAYGGESIMHQMKDMKPQEEVPQ